MKILKRSLLLFLALAMIFSAAACGSLNDDPQESDSDSDLSTDMGFKSLNQVTALHRHGRGHFR